MVAILGVCHEYRVCFIGDISYYVIRNIWGVLYLVSSVEGIEFILRVADIQSNCNEL
jgi:hypothetical protein